MDYNVIIVGAGPAGLSAAIYVQRSGKSALVLEATTYGGQIINTPDIANYPGLAHVSGVEFATNLYNQAKELGAEAKETGDVDYVWNARELYRVFLRTGGAPHRKGATAFDSFGGEDAAMPYPELLGDKEWTLTSDFEETAILVGGKAYKCAVAHNLGQVRRLLEGEYKNYDVIRLMA